VTARHLSPVPSVASSAGPCAAALATGESSYAERLVDALDLAQSQLDEAEQLFCAGHEEAGLRCVGEAMRALEGIQ
jgi:hypothetical protein